MTTEIKLPFGLRDEKLVHISEVKRGLACNCICPSCHQSLVARKGPEKTHHFAHYNGNECEHATETALHLAAKEIIEQEKRLYLPPVTFTTSIREWMVFKGGIIHFDEIKLEHHIGNIRPDILAYSNGIPLMIEILVTHGIDDNKLDHIKELGISTLEISLEGMARMFTLEALKSIVVSDTTNKKWIYNQKADMLIRHAYALAYSSAGHKIAFDTGIPPSREKMGNKYIKNGGLRVGASIVRDCPLKKRVVKFGKFSATSWKDDWAEGDSFAIATDWNGCFGCPFCLDLRQSGQGVRPNLIVVCLGKYNSDVIISNHLKNGYIPPNWHSLK